MSGISHTLELKDKNGELLFENDIVMGKSEFITSDGYLSVRAPKEIDILFKILWNKYCGEYHLEMIDVVKEQIKHTRARQYRRTIAHLMVSSKRNADGHSIGECREDMVCETLEKVFDKKLIAYANALLRKGITNGYSHYYDWDTVEPIYRKLGVEEEHLAEAV